jgi:2-iminoacetate synthase ThiH
MEQIYDTAYNIKERIYGNRIVLFAPLYIANYCVNNCAYCAFRAANKDIEVSVRLTTATCYGRFLLPSYFSNMFFLTDA